MSAPEREFRFYQDRFYSPIVEGGPIGVWELRSVIVDEIPQRSAPVAIGRANPPILDETGRTWQDRAIAAEMAAADLRARRDGFERRALGAEASAASLREELEHLRAHRQTERQAEWNALAGIAREVARVYRREDEMAELLAGKLVMGGCADPDCCNEQPEPPSVAELQRWILETLQLDHPAVRFPEPGAATIANAQVLARTELCRDGATLNDVAVAILRMAAEPQRPRTGAPS